MTVDLLFVYGTLLDKDNAHATYLRKNADLHADGSLNGRLYNAGAYPAAVYDEKTTSIIYGAIYKLNHPRKVLKLLDDYEGIGKKHEEPHEYRRELIAIDAAGGTVKCWVYVYNRSTEGMELIPSGRWLK